MRHAVAHADINKWWKNRAFGKLGGVKYHTKKYSALLPWDTTAWEIAHYHIFPDHKIHHILSMKIMDWGGDAFTGDKVAKA